MIDARYAPMVVAVCVCVLVFVRNKMDEAAQPNRLELAERGEALLAHPRVNRHVKEHIRFCLSHAFGGRASLLYEILFIPVFSLIVLFKMKWICQILRVNSVDDKETRADVTEFFALFEDIAWINNPLLMAVRSLEFHLFVSIAIIIRMVLLNAFPRVETWTVKPALEETIEWLISRIRLRIA